MSPITVSLIIFACIFGGALLGMLLRPRLPEHHLSSDSKDVIKLSMGLIGTMTALVLGLLVASAKSTFDNQRNGVAQLSANLITLDRLLAHYGKDTQQIREQLKGSAADMIQRTWPEEYGGEKTATEGRYEDLYERILELTPKNEAQRNFQSQALKISTDTAQARWLLFSQKGSSIPIPFLVVMVCWLTLILGSFGLFAPRNATALLALMICSLVVSSAIFLILELDRPFESVIKISSTPLRNAVDQLGK
jgi:hypothetical protein